jgi:hypothetical protein
MYRVEIERESIERQALERRKKLDQERKERIFNPKVRVIGVISPFIQVDVLGLDSQLATKNKIKELDTKREMLFGRIVLI